MTASRIRLGLYCPGTGTGGPWRYAHSILAALDPAEFEVTVFSDLTEYSPRPWVKAVSLTPAMTQHAVAETSPLQARPRRSPLARLAPPAVKWWAGFGREVRRFARVIRRHPVDVFHTQNTGCEESPVAARLAGVPRVVGTFHVDSTYDLHRERSGPSFRLMEVVSNQCLDIGIAVSHETGRDWVRRTRLSASRVTTIHNGIDPDRFRRRQSRAQARAQLGLPADAQVVGGLGRLDEAKGFEFLVAAAAELRAEFPRLVVAIAGSGPRREYLEAEAERRGVADCVRFLGFQPDVQPVLDALDVFAMPSRCEALPYALLEAMATELPAVAAAVGGIPEVVTGETGLVVPPRDPAALAAALRVLLNDEPLRARMGVDGRVRVVRHFHERDMVRKTVEVYRDASAGRVRFVPGGVAC